MRFYFSEVVSILSGVQLAFAAGLDLAQPPDASTTGDNLLQCVKGALNEYLRDYRIVTPDRKEYETVSTGVILVRQYPAVVTYPTEIEEVVKLVKCGYDNGYKVSPRSGAHHFENWSALNGTLVIDISHIDHVKPSSDLNTAVVGAGARLGTVYSILGKYGRTWVAGICPSVGLGGYISVGGYNMQMRKYGLAVDWLESAKVVLANGTIVNASETENQDLWWAMRGGGTFGLTVEAVLKLTTIPRSAMLSMNAPKESRLEVLKRFVNWAPAQDPLFNSQLNLYGDHANILGWYIGESKGNLDALMHESGLLAVPGAQFNITGNCSTENSRNFWVYTQQTCTDDETAHGLSNLLYNVVPDDIVPINNVSYSFDDTPALPDEPQAMLWPHLGIVEKTYVQRLGHSSLSDEDLQWIIERTGQLPAELGVWAEITTFNMSSAPPSTSSFPWFQDAEIMFRVEVKKVENEEVMRQGQQFIDELDRLMLAKLGTASYAGYIDAKIQVDPHQAYWGTNVGRLAEVKAAYDESDLFSNPFSIRPKA
ncbi:hypothetical protein BDV38DRAFT_282746 [Aspergillus pseudotamarii]|uniref:FAD-binding PCMH-type domain-containing protein n=1 Tax=Aspergillus pseudotamarii TaxID=132259 RepID=A0A5N6SV99_ASPPS|nr:uncharacterized protein BDV38DRAFT_282746 [Aspergillus pseudotamarii]KAE8137817.1 hypothetical protein BDV38DRAFT_282746 [Aspergillus pseudotamarii]